MIVVLLSLYIKETKTDEKGFLFGFIQIIKIVDIMYVDDNYFTLLRKFHSAN